MPEPEPFLLFIRKLEELGFPYAVTGSVAASYYGEPRLTYDVDVVLSLRPEDAPRLEEVFPEAEFYRPPRETRGHFNLIHHKTGFKADLYLEGSDPLHRWALASARKTRVDDVAVSLAPPEYVVLRKLQFYREGRSEKHLRDIRRMLETLGDGWDRAGLEARVRAEGLEAEWKEASTT